MHKHPVMQTNWLPFHHYRVRKTYCKLIGLPMHSLVPGTGDKGNPCSANQGKALLHCSMWPCTFILCVKPPTQPLHVLLLLLVQNPHYVMHLLVFPVNSFCFVTNSHTAVVTHETLWYTIKQCMEVML